MRERIRGKVCGGCEGFGLAGHLEISSTGWKGRGQELKAQNPKLLAVQRRAATGDDRASLAVVVAHAYTSAAPAGAGNEMLGPRKVNFHKSSAKTLVDAAPNAVCPVVLRIRQRRAMLRIFGGEHADFGLAFFDVAAE